MQYEDSSPDSGHYVIRVAGHVAHHWFTEGHELSVRWEADGATLFAGVLPDQAALHGLLARIRDLGLTLLSVERGPDRDPGGPYDTS